MAASSARPNPTLAASITLVEVILLFAGIRLRRKAGGFKPSELRHGSEEQRRLFRGVGKALVWVMVGQGIVAAIAVGLCAALGRRDLIWPALALVISVHFAPLGRIVRVRVYYALAALGTAASLIALTVAMTSRRRSFGGASRAACEISRST
jgi:hypothetical protein